MESLVEGVFGRAFKRQVHPVEIAKGLTKQMDENRMVSVSRIYAPNDFTIHLSKADAESIQAYQSALEDELIQYVSTHAQSKNYHLMTPPKIPRDRPASSAPRRPKTRREKPRGQPLSPPKKRRGRGLRGRWRSWFWMTKLTRWRVKGRGASGVPRRTT